MFRCPSISKALLANRVPRNELPPVRGTTPITGPPTSASPMPPDTLNVTSAALPMSATLRHAAAVERCANALAVHLQPPPFARPPCALNVTVADR